MNCLGAEINLAYILLYFAETAGRTYVTRRGGVTADVIGPFAVRRNRLVNSCLREIFVFKT